MGHGLHWRLAVVGALDRGNDLLFGTRQVEREVLEDALVADLHIALRVLDEGVPTRGVRIALQRVGQGSTQVGRIGRAVHQGPDLRIEAGFYLRNWQSASIDHFMRAVDGYVRWYNESRIKMFLGAISPVEYRESLGTCA